MKHLLDNPKLWPFLQSHVMLNPLRDIFFAHQVPTSALTELNGRYCLAWSNFSRYLCPFYFSPLSTQVPDTRIHQSQKRGGEKKDIRWSPVSHLNLLGDISSRTGRGIRMPCHPWKQHCTCSLVRTLVCCADVVSPLYPPQLIELKDYKWTLTKELWGWRRSTPLFMSNGAGTTAQKWLESSRDWGNRRRGPWISLCSFH